MAIWNVDVEISVALTSEQRGGVFNAIEEDPRSPLDGVVGDPRGRRECAWISVEAPSAQEAAALAAEIVGNGLRRIGVSAELVTNEVEDADRRIADAEPVRLRV